MQSNYSNYLCLFCLIGCASCQPKQELILFEEESASTEKSTVNLQAIDRDPMPVVDHDFVGNDTEMEQLAMPYFEYQPQLRRSPFLSDHLGAVVAKKQLNKADIKLNKAATKIASLPQPERNRVKDVLENYALSQLKFRGAIRQQGQYWVGLVELPDGYVHQVKSGQFVGLKQAKIIAIQPDEITLQQKDALGQFHRRSWTRQ